MQEIRQECCLFKIAHESDITICCDGVSEFWSWGCGRGPQQLLIYISERKGGVAGRLCRQEDGRGVFCVLPEYHSCGSDTGSSWVASHVLGCPPGPPVSRGSFHCCVSAPVHGPTCIWVTPNSWASPSPPDSQSLRTKVQNLCLVVTLVKLQLYSFSVSQLIPPNSLWYNSDNSWTHGLAVLGVLLELVVLHELLLWFWSGIKTMKATVHWHREPLASWPAVPL